LHVFTLKSLQAREVRRIRVESMGRFRESNSSNGNRCGYKRKKEKSKKGH
jgi:hypothetical protein